MNPQLFGVVMDRLYAAGALEVFYVPVQMKKNRPGTLLTVIARARTARPDFRHHLPRDDDDRPAALTKSIASACEREIVTVETPIGAVRFKVARRDGRVVNAVPEFDDCARLAAANNLSVKEVQAHGRLRRTAPARAALVSRFYLTTAIDYVNSRPHLGHGVREDRAPTSSRATSGSAASRRAS